MADRQINLRNEYGAMIAYTFTDKQLAFVEAYLDTLNGSEAARRAHYGGNNNTLSTIAYQNLRKPHIAMLIRQRMSVECMTQAETLRHLARIARGVDLTEYITEETNEDGAVIIGFDIAQLRSDGHGDLIKTITSARGGGVRIEFYSRLDALNSIARHHALFVDVIVRAEASDRDLLNDQERITFAENILERLISRQQAGNQITGGGS